MTALVSPLTRVSKAGVSTASVDGQIDTKNHAQDLEINLQYATLATTYSKSEVYTKPESDAALQLKGSAAQLATVTAYANTLPTLSTVNSVLNARFIIQDSNNLVTFGAKSDVTANTTAIATATAATVTNQSGIAAVNGNIANILTGSAALETLHVFNETVGESNTLEIKNKPDALNVASLQIEHELTASAQLAKVNFWDTSIPNSASTSSATALTLSWDGDANTHTSTFAGGLTVAGTMACTNLVCTGIATLPGSGASAGDVLKSSRVLINNAASANMTNNWHTVFNHAHTPSDASSYLNVTFTGLWRLRPTGGSQDGEWRISLFVDGTSIGDCFLRNDGAAPVGQASPCFGQYQNSSLASKTISLRAIRTNHFQTSKFYLNYTHQVNSNWLHIEEVKR